VLSVVSAPLTLLLNWRLGLVLVVLVVIFLMVTTLVVRKTESAQRRVERFNSSLAGTAQDALSKSWWCNPSPGWPRRRAVLDIAQQLIHTSSRCNWWALST